ncbi:MAG: phosphatidylglycerophosphatase A, partial [Pseudomonadota bacterium]
MNDKNAMNVSARTVPSDPVHGLAFGFAAGLAPRAPGTAGSVWGILLASLTVSLGWQLELLIAVIISLTGIWICG